MTERTVHHGRNIKRIREIQGIKQEALALELGEDWNQKKISLLEGKEEIDPELLEQVAKALKVPVDTIKNFDEQAAINIISNTFNSNSHDQSSIYTSALNYQPTFNPIDRWIEALEDNKRLYERLLQSEREKVELLEKVLDLRK
jgi:transcriptional regulator with XRE-family HTH domain